MSDEKNEKNEVKDEKTYTDGELKAMEEDVKSSLDKEKRELVEKTIADTKKRLEEEKRIKEMQEELKRIKDEKEVEKKKYQEDLDSLKDSFKEESEKMIREFQDSRKSTVSTENPFKNDGDGRSDDVVSKFNSDEEYAKQLDAASRKAFADSLGIRERDLI